LFGRNYIHYRLSIAAGALLVASPAFAEVADKEPSVGSMWMWALGFNVVSVLLEALGPRLGLLVVPFAAFVAWAGHSELTDPHVGPAILRELGADYVSTSYVCYGVGLLGPLLIVLLCSIARRRKPLI
jgi:hypothetical protein